MNEQHTDHTEQLVGFLKELEVVKIVREYYARFNNDAPPQLLERYMDKAMQSWDKRLGKDKVPDPSNDTAMSELHKFVEEWAKRHNLQGAQELHYLGLYLTGRLNVQVKLENLKKLYPTNEPMDIPKRVEELIAFYEANYCECSYPGADSVTAKSGTCATCGKPVRNGQ